MIGDSSRVVPGVLAQRAQSTSIKVSDIEIARLKNNSTQVVEGKLPQK